MSADPHNARLDTLELKFMDLENTVQQLHEVILRQFNDIVELETQLNTLSRRIDNSGDTGDAAPHPTLSDERPPHY